MCSKSSYMLLKVIYITLFTALEAQKLEVKPEVTGYLGQDVTLSCKFIQGQQVSNITAVQWNLNEKTYIIFSNSYFGTNIPETSLKGRVELDGQSLIIQNVKMEDAGSYSCLVAAFPSGAFEATTKLVVQDLMQMVPLALRMTATGIFIMIVSIMAARTYIISLRIRREALVRDQMSELVVQ